MCFESEARGSRRNRQPSTSASSTNCQRKGEDKAKLRHLLPQRAHGSKRSATTPSNRGLTRLRKVVHSTSTSFQPSENSYRNLPQLRTGVKGVLPSRAAPEEDEVSSLAVHFSSFFDFSFFPFFHFFHSFIFHFSYFPGFLILFIFHIFLFHCFSFFFSCFFSVFSFFATLPLRGLDGDFHVLQLLLPHHHSSQPHTQPFPRPLSEDFAR